MVNMRRSAGLLLAAILLPGPAPAQKPESAPRTTASVELTLFNLDVIVTDAKGDPVRGLKPEDFEVRHDGKVVKLTNFSEVRGSGFPAVAAPAEPPPPGTAPAVEAAPAARRPPRRIVLFFDRLQLPDANQRKELFDSVRRLLEETLDDDDEAMIVTWNRSIRTVLPFTGDPDRLAKSLETVERESSGVASEKADLDLLRDEDAWFTSLAADPRIGTDFGGFTPTASVFAQQAFFEMKAKTAALKGLSATLGGMEGRKILVLVSHRFSRYAGLEFYLKARTGVEALNDPRTKEYDTKRLLEEVTRSANANGVTLYGVFPAGMDAPQPSAADPISEAPGVTSQAYGGRELLALSNELEALSFVAEKTGGVAAAGAGSLPAFIDRVSSDLDSWYSLGYPSPSGAGKAASVSVRLRNGKLNARVRGSVVEKTLEEQMSDRVLAHLFKPDDRAKIPISVSASVAPGPSKKFRIRIEVRIPIASLVLLPSAKGAAGAFSVFVASVAAKGDFSEVSRRSQSFEIPGKDVETAKAGHYTYEIEVESSGPDARVCVGVWDEKGNDAGFAVVRPSGPGS